VGEDEPIEPKKKEASVTLATIDKDWVYPSIDLVKSTSTQADPGDAKATAKLIKEYVC
jgi:hypothetical protein